MRRIAVAILTVAVCFLAGCGYTKDLEEGIELLKEGAHGPAEKAFERAASGKAKDEVQAEACKGLGLIAYDRGEYAAAWKYFEEALELGGEKTPLDYRLIGICAMNETDYEAALEAFEKGTSLENAKEEVYAAAFQEMCFSRIICYEKLRDWENAKAAAEFYIADYPEDAAAQKEAEFLRTR